MSASLAGQAELELLARLRADDSRTAAFGELIAMLRDSLFALCIHVTGNASDAEDALQETLLAIHGGLPSFRGDARIATWAHRIAIRSALRVRARRPRTEELAPDWPAAAKGDTLIEAESGARLAAALDRLPATQRVVLGLFALDGLSHTQIAEILGIPEGTAWSRLHAARKALIEGLQTD